MIENPAPRNCVTQLDVMITLYNEINKKDIFL